MLQKSLLKAVGTGLDWHTKRCPELIFHLLISLGSQDQVSGGNEKGGLPETEAKLSLRKWAWHFLNICLCYYWLRSNL